MGAPALANQPAKAILLRSGWQTVNIGDITHTPGVLAVIERNLPDTRVFLWPGNDLDRGVEPMLRRRFRRLEIVKGGVTADGAPDSAELREAFQQSALMIHGSAASAGSMPQMECWRKTTGRPYGYFGIGFTFAGEAAGAKFDDRLQNLLKGARFVYTRETASLANLRKANIAGPQPGFVPDGTFSFDIRDDDRGQAFLRESRLEPGKFIAIVPRLRFTPYHRIRSTPPYGADEAARRDAINDRHAETDHAKLRELATAWVTKTGGKVLFCPEMTYQVDIIEPLLIRALPEDIKRSVVARKTYWLPDEAASVYSKAAAVVSMECHSPIIAAAAGTPCAYVHQPEDGIKGHMWTDVGLKDWYYEVEQTTGAQLTAGVLAVTGQISKSREKVRRAVKFARQKQDEAMRSIRMA